MRLLQILNLRGWFPVVYRWVKLYGHAHMKPPIIIIIIIIIYP